MKRLVAFLLMAVMLFAVSGCGSPASEPQGGGSAATPTPAAPAPTENVPEEPTGFKAAALLPGPINDNGWNAGAYAGLKYLEETYGATIAYTENVASSDMEEFLLNYAQQGYDMIVCHGTQFVDSAKKVAPQFPEIAFLISNADVDNSQAPNLACFGTVYSGFLAGAVAACVTQTNTVAVLGGEQIPAITPIVEQFVRGAKAVKPDINVLSGYIGSLVDADKAKEMALNYIKNDGADVVCASANAAGLGVIQAADESGKYAIGFNSDQYGAAPNAVFVSVLRNFEGMFDQLYQEIVNGTYEAKVYAFGIAEGGTILSDWHGWDEKLGAETVAKIEQAIQDIKDGKIVVS